MALLLTIETVEMPVGAFLLAANEGGVLRAAEFADCEERLRRPLERRFGPAGYHLRPGTVPAEVSRATIGADSRAGRAELVSEPFPVGSPW